MNRILLVEDSADIRKGVAYSLKTAGYEVDACKNAAEAEKMALSRQYDLAILDIMLPDGDGFTLCKNIREWVPDTPVLFLTAKDEENDIVHGFDMGADDYVTKPFRSRELLSRVANIMRRYKKDASELRIGDVRIDLLANRVYKGEEEVILTALEYRIVVLLFQNAGKTVPRERILDRIWDYEGNVVNDNTLTVYIRRIRGKLGEDVITTIKGIGYRAG